MGHKFPPNRMLEDWPIDAYEVNDNLREVAEELEGRINEHNVKAGTFNDRNDCANGAIIDINNGFTVVNPSLNGADGSAAPSYPGLTFTPTDQLIISTSSEWQTVISTNKFTANSLLWIISSFQQQLYDADVASEIDQYGTQYCIRLDGSLIEESTIGGFDRENDPRGEAVKIQADGFVTDAIVPVPSGKHTIELVARVVRDTSFTQPPATEYSTVGSRELIIITLDPYQIGVAGTGALWTPLAEGDSINATVVTAPFTGLTGELNALDYPAIQPESLHAEHLTGVVILSDYMTIGAAVTHTYNNIYPGWDSNTINAGTGWQVVTQGVALSFTFAAQDLTDPNITGVLVMFDVNIISIDDTNAAVGNKFIIYGVFAIQVESGGTWRTVSKTERYSNALVRQDTLVRMNCRRNMPIRTFIRSTDLDGGTSITGVRVVVSGMSRRNFAYTPEIILQQCNLSYAVLKAGP